MTDTGDFRIEASIFVVSFCLSVDVAISSTVKSKLLDWSERMSSVFVLGGWVLEIIYISLRLGASWMRGSGFRKGLCSRMKEMHSGSQKIAHTGGSAMQSVSLCEYHDESVLFWCFSSQGRLW